MLRYVLLALMCWPALAAAQPAQPAADFRFQNDLADSLDNSVDLSPLVPDDPAGAFMTARIADQPRRVRAFSAGAGFALPLDGLLPNGYSVAILLLLHATDDYAKILDTQARAADSGLYAVGQDLRLYNALPASSRGRFGANRWHQVVVTRDASGVYTGYIDGQLEFSGDDDGDGAISAADILHFFVDDTVTVGEQSSGAVARIRLYNSVLDAGAVATLDDNQFDLFRDGFEAPQM